MNLKTQSGRSMVEMLGTLAIIGVLSIGGIAGYKYGMDKYRANQTINDVNLRAIDLISQLTQGHILNLDSWTTTSTAGYPISLNSDEAPTNYYIKVEKVPLEVCNMINQNMPDNVKIWVDNDMQACAEGLNVMDFDLAGFQGGHSGYGENTPVVEPEVSVDPCLSVFSDWDGNEYSCCTLEVVTGVLQSDCERCPNNRIFSGYDYDGYYEGLCLPADYCPNGFWDHDGRCFSCSYGGIVWTPETNSCTRCSERKSATSSWISGVQCVPAGYCPNGFWDERDNCYPCSYSEVVHRVDPDVCRTCTGREASDDFSLCVPADYCPGGFYDSYGNCYPCSTPEVVKSVPVDICERCSNRKGDNWYNCSLK